MSNSHNNNHKKKPAAASHQPAAPQTAEHRPAAKGNLRWAIVAGLLVAAFFGSFAYAQASRGTASAATQLAATGASGQVAAAGQAPADTIVPSQGAASGSAASGGAGAGSGCCGGAGTAGGSAAGGCCGGAGAGSAAATKGAAVVSGGVQKVTVDLTKGTYTPNQISAKAGVPIEITFKGPASGCNGSVQSQDLGFQQDVSNGGTIKVGPLKPGTYTWACSMNMYHASIVVK